MLQNGMGGGYTSSEVIMYGPLSFLSLGDREGRQSITRKMGKITPTESRFPWKIDLKTLDPFHWPYLITSRYWPVIVIPLNGSVSLVFHLLVIHFKYLLGPWQHLYICPWGVRLPKSIFLQSMVSNHALTPGLPLSCCKGMCQVWSQNRPPRLTVFPEEGQGTGPWDSSPGCFRNYSGSFNPHFHKNIVLQWEHITSHHKAP